MSPTIYRVGKHAYPNSNRLIIMPQRYNIKRMAEIHYLLRDTFGKTILV